MTEATSAIDAGTAAATTAAATTTAVTTPAPIDMTGFDAETTGRFQNRGYDKMADWKAVAIAADKAHREAEGRLGVPADQLLRLPKEANDEAGWKEVHRRLGVPGEAKDYDLSAVKFSDQSAIDENLATFIRETAFDLKLPKDRATELAQRLVKFTDASEARDADDQAAAVAAERATLDKNWGPNKEANMFVAKQGAARVGVQPEEVAALEKSIGYARVMEMFRKIGDGLGEGRFVQSGAPGAGNQLMTREQAIASKAELMKDASYTKKLLDGDTEAVRKMTALNTMIVGSV